MDTIKFPISFDSTGCKKLTEGTSDYYKQLLSFAALTEPGTFKLSPRFGTFDASFGRVDNGMFMVHAARFIPEITIGEVSSNVNPSNSTLSVNVEFRIN